jgi:hypothetical protein
MAVQRLNLMAHTEQAVHVVVDITGGNPPVFFDKLSWGTLDTHENTKTWILFHIGLHFLRSLNNVI